MAELPEAKWSCGFGEASGLEPMSLPIHEEGDMWYVEGVGHVDNQNRLYFGLPAHSMRNVMKTAYEIIEWRKVAAHLEADGDIMDITVPHENDRAEPTADGLILKLRIIGTDFFALLQDEPLLGYPSLNPVDETLRKEVSATINAYVRDHSSET